MNHIHIEIKPGAVATFSQELTKETLEAVKKLIEAAEKKLNEPEERYFSPKRTFVDCNKDKVYKIIGTSSGRFTFITDEGLKDEIAISNTIQVAKQDYLNQEAKNKIIEEKKPLFEFEGHKYFKGDEAWWFNKKDYTINGMPISAVHNLNEVGRVLSKTYPTKQQCKESLYNHIWDNHKTTAKEVFSIIHSNCEQVTGKTDKDYFCETIIKQQNK